MLFIEDYIYWNLTNVCSFKSDVFLLKLEQEDKLIEVLRKHKRALGWTIADIKGINPAICMHRILMEENYKPIVQPQRRLNPAMQEVVKKEVVKLLAAGHDFYCFPDGYSGYNQIPIAPEDQEKTTFTCPQDGMIRRCVPEMEMNNILSHCHDGAVRGHWRKTNNCKST